MPAPSALAPNDPLRVLLFAGESAQAEAVLRTLKQARLAVRGLYTQQPQRLAVLVQTHPCNLVIAWLSGNLRADELAAGYRGLLLADQAAGIDPPPLLVLYDDRQALADLGTLAAAGAAPLLPAADPAALVAAVRRQDRLQRMSARLADMEAEDAGLRAALRLLVGSVAQPIARVRAGQVVEVNPSFAQWFGGGGAAALAGRPLKDLVLPADQAVLTTLLGANLLLELPNPPADRIRFLDAEGTPHACRMQVHACGPLAPDCVWVLVQPEEAAAAPPPERLPVDERALLRARLEERLAGAAGAAEPFALAWVLVPGYGDWLRSAGFDQVEAGMAALRDAVVAVAPPPALVGRLADDAFAALLPGVDRADRGSLRIRLSSLLTVRDAGDPAGRPPVAVGVLVAEPGEFTLGALLDQARADALRAVEPRPLPTAPAPPAADAPAKPVRSLRGPRRSAQPTEQAPAAISDPNSVEARLERALGTNALGLMYQPIISLMGDSQEHYSVLLRLEEGNQSMLNAAELVKAAARAGNLPAVDRWVINRALQELARQRRNGHKVGLFLSLAAETMREDDLLLFVCDALREHDVLGNWLTFQAQEGVVRANLQRWVTLCDGLHSIHCRVAINQFGHDPRPAELLAAYPVDFVKFAPEFAIGLAEDIDKQRRLAELAKLAREAKARIIVGGVEDPATLTVLWSNTVDYVQGNFLQMPSYTLDPPGE